MHPSLFIGFLFVAACLPQIQCNEQPNASGSTKTLTSRSPGGVVFQLSTTPPPIAGDQAANWCYGNFSQTLVINAEKINTNRRFFFLPQGITKLAVGPSNSSATLLLHPLHNGNVEVFTGSNFPDCLSNPANLSPSGGAYRMRYNNNTNIDFQLEVQIEGQRLKITLEFNPGAIYAINAAHCPECQ